MKTIIAAFIDRGTAQQGADLLRARLSQTQDADKFRPTLIGYEPGDDILKSLEKREVPKERAQVYAEVIRRGAVVLTAEVPDDQARALADELDQMGSLDLDSAEKRWRSSGWTGYDTTATAYDDEDSAMERRAFENESQYGTGRQGSMDSTAGDRDLEVIEEDVQVGKRAVQRGGVRIRTYITERPIEETVELHEERIDVQREAVDEPISAAAMDSTFTEDEFEITARGEEVVVGKEARVVERVHVGKTAETRTEKVQETERRRDVEVEKIDEGTTKPDRPRSTR